MSIADLIEQKRHQGDINRMSFSGELDQTEHTVARSSMIHMRLCVDTPINTRATEDRAILRLENELRNSLTLGPAGAGSSERVNALMALLLKENIPCYILAFDMSLKDQKHQMFVDLAPVNEASDDEASDDEVPVNEASDDEASVNEASDDEASVNEAPDDEAPVGEAFDDEVHVNSDEYSENDDYIEHNKFHQNENGEWTLLPKNPDSSMRPGPYIEIGRTINYCGRVFTLDEIQPSDSEEQTLEETGEAKRQRLEQ
jgi:hypothetical protein